MLWLINPTEFLYQFTWEGIEKLHLIVYIQGSDKVKNTVSLLAIATLVYLVFEYITPLLRAIYRKLLICLHISNLKEAISGVYKKPYSTGSDKRGFSAVCTQNN